MLNNAKTIEQKSRLKAKLNKDKHLAREWSAKQKQHTKRNYLDRDRNRERPGIIVNDIGVKRNQSV